MTGYTHADIQIDKYETYIHYFICLILIISSNGISMFGIEVWHCHKIRSSSPIVYLDDYIARGSK